MLADDRFLELAFGAGWATIWLTISLDLLLFRQKLVMQQVTWQWQRPRGLRVFVIFAGLYGSLFAVKTYDDYTVTQSSRAWAAAVTSQWRRA